MNIIIYSSSYLSISISLSIHLLIFVLVYSICFEVYIQGLFFISCRIELNKETCPALGHKGHMPHCKYAPDEIRKVFFYAPHEKL